MDGARSTELHLVLVLLTSHYGTFYSGRHKLSDGLKRAAFTRFWYHRVHAKFSGERSNRRSEKRQTEPCPLRTARTVRTVCTVLTSGVSLCHPGSRTQLLTQPNIRVENVDLR